MYGSGQYYNPLIEAFEEKGYTQGENLFVAFYDWRQPNADSATDYLKPVIDEALSKSASSTRVDIVAHSMGGLIARSYIQSDEYENDVDDLVTLGSPHEGSSSAYELWAGGILPDEWERTQRAVLRTYIWYQGPGFNTFEIIRDEITSMRELLPTYDYLVEKDSGSTILYEDMEEQNPLLNELNAPEKLTLLHDRVDEIYTIVGDAQATVGMIPVDPGESSGDKWKDGKPNPEDPEANTTEGDNRVLLTSADIAFFSPITQTPIYPSYQRSTTLDRLARLLFGNYAIAQTQPDIPFGRPANEAEGCFVEVEDEEEQIGRFQCGKIVKIEAAHASLPSAAAGEVLSALGIGGVDESLPIYVEPEAILSFMVASPVAITVTDPDGNSISRDGSEIPDAEYSGTDDPAGPKMIFIENPKDGDYTVKLEAVGDGGEYRFGSMLVNDTTDTTVSTSSEVGAGETHTYQVSAQDVSSGDDLTMERTEEESGDEEGIGELSALEHVQYLIGYVDELQNDGEIRRGVWRQLRGPLMRANQTLQAWQHLETKIDSLPERWQPHARRMYHFVLKRFEKVLARQARQFTRAVNRAQKKDRLAEDEAEYLLGEVDEIKEKLANNNRW